MVSVHSMVCGAVRYERMPHICFYCRRIGHILKFCLDTPENLGEEENDNLGYGEWMEVYVYYEGSY